MPPKKVIIIGAGIGGLATANLLAKAGFDVHVYETHASPGGRVGTFTIKGFTFDTGPSWYLMPSVFEHYFNLLGTSADKELDLLRLKPAYKVFFDSDEPIVITGSLGADSKTFELIERGAGASLKNYVQMADNTYKLSLKHFLYSNFTSPRDFLHRDIVRGSMRMLKMLKMPIDHYVSTFVRDRRLKQILEYPMVFLGTSPFKAPALYSLMSALDFKEGVYYPRGGIYTIINSMVSIGKELGVKYHYNNAVAAINVAAGKATGVTFADRSKSNADIVISNADLHYTEHTLLRKEHQSYDNTYWSKKEAGPSALLIYLGIKGKLPEFQHHNLLFVDEWKENFDAIFESKKPPLKASLYISMTSKSEQNVAPKGHENIFVLVPLPAGIPYTDKKIESLRHHYINQIKMMTGVDLEARAVIQKIFGPNDFETQFHSWQASMLGQSHILKQSALFRTRNVSKKVQNLYYVGANTVPGIGLPMCLISAELIYKRLAGNRGGGRVDNIKNLQDKKS